MFLFASCKQVQQNLNSVYLQGLFEWLKSAELRSTEEFMVETDLESVKGQLCDLKVSFVFVQKCKNICSTDAGVLERITISALSPGYIITKHQPVCDGCI